MGDKAKQRESELVEAMRIAMPAARHAGVSERDLRATLKELQDYHDDHGSDVEVAARSLRTSREELDGDPDVRIAGITAPFIAELRTGSGRTIRVGKSGVERIRQVVNHEGHVLYHVVDGEGERQWLVYDGVEAELTRERSGFRGAKRRER